MLLYIGCIGTIAATIDSAEIEYFEAFPLPLLVCVGFLQPLSLQLPQTNKMSVFILVIEIDFVTIISLKKACHKVFLLIGNRKQG